MRPDNDVLSWLLEREDPSVRFHALRELLGLPDSNPDVVRARSEIPNSKVVKRIFSKQNEDGSWGDPLFPYDKYKGSYWTFMLLGHLGLTKEDERVGRAAEHIFRFQLDEGGFSCYGREGTMQQEGELERHRRKVSRIRKEPVGGDWVYDFLWESELSCLTGNVVAAMLRTGFQGDPRVSRAIEWLLQIQNQDGGWLCPNWSAHIKDTHSCFMGTICPLEAFSEVPEAARTSEMQEAIERSAEFLLMHRLYKADHHDFRVIKERWLLLAFPWFWDYSVLRGLVVLSKLGYAGDPRTGGAFDLLLEKRRPDGKWVLERSPSKVQASLDKKNEPSKWITLKALIALKGRD